MKKVILIAAVTLLILITNLITDAQTTFNITLKDPSTDEVVNDALELQDGSFILACVQQSPAPFKGHLVKLSKSGQLIRDTIYDFQNQYSGTFSILQTSADKYLIASYTLNENNLWEIWLFRTDSTLKTIDEKIINLDTNSVSQFAVEIQESGNILLSGILQTPFQRRYPFIYELSSTFDSLKYKIFTDHQTAFQPSLLRKIQDNGYYFFLYGYNTASGYAETILNLDNSFSIINSAGVPFGVGGYPNSNWISSNKFILTGRKDSDSLPNDRGIELLIMDTNFTVYHNLFIGDHDTVEWQAFRRNLDFINADSIYIGGTHNMCLYEFCDTTCWYSLSNVDSALNMRWEKYYGDHADYTLYGLKATRDGGCLLYGTVYDSTMNYQRDVCVIKVDKNGLISGINNSNNRLIHDVIVYPNPGTNHLIIESGPQVSGSQFTLHNLEGKPILQQFLKNRKTILDTHLLQPGTYIWQLEYQGKIIESGKWIKAE